MKTKLFTLILILFGLMNSNDLNAQCQAFFTSTADSINPGGHFFHNASPGGSAAAAFWSFGDGTSSYQSNPYHLYNSIGYHTVCLTITDSVNMCTSTYCDSIYSGSAFPTCSANFVSTVNSMTAAFNSTSTSSSGIITNYYWNFGDGSTSTATNPTHTYSVAGIFNVCLTMIDSSSGCSDQTCHSVTINSSVPCNATFTIIDSSNVLYFIPNNNTPNNYTYSWTFGDGTTSTSYIPTHVYSQPGYYMACLTVSNVLTGCVATSCDTASYQMGGSGCNATIYSQSGTGNQMFFYASNPASNIVSYLWLFGDGSGYDTSASPTHTYPASGQYTVCLATTTSLGCTDSVCKVITVGSASTCNAAFAVNDTGSAVYFYPLNCTPNTATFVWNFGDGTSSTTYQPYHTYALSGTYYVCLTVTNLLNTCTDTYCDTVVYNPSGSQCYHVFTYNCLLNNQVSFMVTTSSSNIVSYLWDFGDSTTSSLANPTHQYANSGYYTVCLTTVTNLGCTNTTCVTVLVGTAPSCDASFAHFDSSGYEFFIPNSINTTQTYYWTFGDGSSSLQMNPIHQYVGNGPWTACLTVIDSLANCTNQQCVVVTNPVSGPCNSSFTYTTNPGTILAAFINTSTGNYTNYTWSFGDGTSSTNANPSHTYAIQGTYLVCLTVYNNTTGCQSSFCDSIVIGNGQANQCVPVFYSYPDSSVFGNGIVYFGIINSCPGSTYTWSVNGTAFGTGTNPVILFPDSGWYYICVTGVTPNGTYVTCDSVYSLRLAGATGITENGNQIPVTISPNPANGPINLSFQLAQSESVTFQLMTLDGREVMQQQEKLSAGIHQQIIATENIASGLYLIRLQAGGKQSISRIAIQH